VRPVRVLLLGHGRMGTLVEALAPEYGAAVVQIVTRGNAGVLDTVAPHDVDVAIDFTEPSAVRRNLQTLASRGINVVIGTTGWREDEQALRHLAADANIGVLAAANFSLGMNLFELIVEDAARRFSAHDAFGAWVHEWHHAAKKDAPSGTALQLRAAIQNAGYAHPVAMSSTRAGRIPGTHEVGFDGPSDTITLTHTVRDRSVFARGALEAARWLVGRRGWFTMRDMLNEQAASGNR
jgi:4-hydroxy-tetrahydrodipicolinate reductase